jgi:dTMP kinase
MYYVIIDGLDGSGKSTQAKLLTDFLVKKGKSVFLRIHPTDDCFFGRRARRFLLGSGKSAHFCSAIFYMCDVLRSVALHSWREFHYIIFVRYLMGTAYLPHPVDRMGYRFFSLIVPKSNLMFFLDVSPSVAYRRNLLRGEPLEMFETVDELERIRKKALALAIEDNWIIVDSDKSIEEIQREIQQRMPQA